MTFWDWAHAHSAAFFVLAALSIYAGATVLHRLIHARAQVATMKALARAGHVAAGWECEGGP